MIGLIVDVEWGAVILGYIAIAVFLWLFGFKGGGPRGL